MAYDPPTTPGAGGVSPSGFGKRRAVGGVPDQTHKRRTGGHRMARQGLSNPRLLAQELYNKDTSQQRADEEGVNSGVLLGRTSNGKGKREEIAVVGATLSDRTLTISGGSFAVSAVKTATFTAATDNTFYPCDTSGGAFTANLPAAAGNAGLMHAFKIVAGSGVFQVTIDGSGAETIEGSGTFGLNDSSRECVVIICDGSNWHILSYYFTT
jgi:hypothetical protein